MDKVAWTGAAELGDDDEQHKHLARGYQSRARNSSVEHAPKGEHLGPAANIRGKLSKDAPIAANGAYAKVTCDTFWLYAIGAI